MARLAFLTLLFTTLVSLVQTKPLSQVSLQPGGTVHTTDSWAYSNCGKPEDIVQINSIHVIPDPPQPGQNLTVNFSGHVTETIREGAYADVTVKLGVVKLLHKQFDLCEEARKANMTVQCPVEPGDYDISQTVALPKEIPRAKFTVNVQGFTEDDEDLVCLELKVNFMKNPFPNLRW